MAMLSRMYFRGLFLFGTVLFTSICLDTVVLYGPIIIAKALSPSTATRCRAVRPGMSREEVLDNITLRFPATYQDLKENRLTFAQGSDGTCVVEFEGGAGRVSRSTFTPNPPSSWDVHGDPGPSN